MTSVAPDEIDAVEAALSLGILVHWALKSDMPREAVDRHYANVAAIIRSRRPFLQAEGGPHE